MGQAEQNTTEAIAECQRMRTRESLPAPRSSDFERDLDRSLRGSGTESDRIGQHDEPEIAERVAMTLRQTYLETTRALVATVEARDPFTQRHSRTVSLYCEVIASRLGLSPARLDSLRTAALLHDIGKIGIPDVILQKPGPLTKEEFEIVKRHPGIAIEILGHASFLSAELPIILHHHESYDGSGYPYRLAGIDIPFESRILAVADAVDTMLSPRSYKRPYTRTHVQDELAAGAGSQFDPEVAQVAHEWLRSMPHVTED